MADAFCTDVCLWVKDVGGQDLRVLLLSLEPGSRIWLSVDGEAIQFERMADGEDGRSTRGFKPIGETAVLWKNRYLDPARRYVEELEVVERPSDAGAAGSGFYDRMEFAGKRA